MDQIAFITGADRGLGLALCAGLLARGWRVFAGQYMPDWPELGGLAERSDGALTVLPLNVGMSESVQAAAQFVARQTDRIDMLINNAGIRAEQNTLREGLDVALMQRAYNVNALGSIRMVEHFLPLLDNGVMKRLCFVSSEAGSIAMATRQNGFGYCMSKTALNMIARIMFNDLRPQGYTFRLYHPGWVRSYMSGQKNTEGDMEPDEAAARALPFFVDARDDEDRLVMIDYQGNEWPF